MKLFLPGDHFFVIALPFYSDKKNVVKRKGDMSGVRHHQRAWLEISPKRILVSGLMIGTKMPRVRHCSGHASRTGISNRNLELKQFARMIRQEGVVAGAC